MVGYALSYNQNWISDNFFKGVGDFFHLFGFYTVIFFFSLFYLWVIFLLLLSPLNYILCNSLLEIDAWI